MIIDSELSYIFYNICCMMVDNIILEWVDNIILEWVDRMNEIASSSFNSDDEDQSY